MVSATVLLLYFHVDVESIYQYLKKKKSSGILIGLVENIDQF